MYHCEQFGIRLDVSKMTENMTDKTSRAICSSTLYHVFLISRIQCIIVIMCSVTMTTQSSDCATAVGIFNTSNDQESQEVKTVKSCLFLLPVPCPPLNSLHLVCDNNLGDPGQTCEDRAFIIDDCLKRYPELYNNSDWKVCLDVNQCVTVFKKILLQYGFINDTVDDGDRVTVTTVTVSTTTSTSDTSCVSCNVTLTPVKSSSTTRTSAHTSIPLDTSTYNKSTMDEAMKKTSGDGGFPPISYIYPIIGAFIIVCEIVGLCIFSCYKKKRQRENAADSLVQQEEVIQPETASPTKAALNANSVYDDDTVLTEDKNIYKSYINLKYIDDTSVESTPEKALIRTNHNV